MQWKTDIKCFKKYGLPSKQILSSQSTPIGYYYKYFLQKRNGTNAALQTKHHT